MNIECKNNCNPKQNTILILCRLIYVPPDLYGFVPYAQKLLVHLLVHAMPYVKIADTKIPAVNNCHEQDRLSRILRDRDDNNVCLNIMKL